MEMVGGGRRRLSIALFLSVFLIALLPILFLSASFYYKSYRDAVAAVDTFQRSYLDDLSSMVEEYLFSSINAANELTTRPNILEYESFPDISPLERVTGPYSQELLVRMYDYLGVKSAGLGELSAFRRNDRRLLFVEYLHEASGTVLTSGPYSYQSGDGTRDIPWYGWYRTVADGTTASAVLTVPKEESGSYNRPLLLAATRVVSGARRITVVLTIDQIQLLTSLVERLPRFPERGTLSIEADGDVFFTHRFSGGVRDRLTSSDGVATVQRGIPLTHWTASLSVSNAEYRERLTGVRAIVVLSASLVLVVTGASLLLSARITTPLARLAGKLSIRAGAGSSITTVLKTGVESIERGVVELLDEKRSLERTVQASLPMYRESFLRGLVSGDAVDAESLEAQFAFLRIDLQASDLIVMTVAFVHRSLPTEPAARRLTVEQTKLALGAAFHGRVRAVQFELPNDRIAVLANAANRTLKPVIEIATTVQRRLRERRGVRLSIGIGYPHQEPTRIHASYEEAEEARAYASLTSLEIGSVLFVGDIRLIRTEPVHYPAEIEKELSALVMTGDGPGAALAFGRMMEGMRVQSLGAGRYRIHHAILRVMNLIYDKRADLDPAYELSADQYATLMRHMEEGREDAAIQLVLEAIRELATLIAGSRQEKERIIADRVRELIERDYRTITLAQVSDELSVSPSVVSRIFKQVQGIGFSDFLTEYRVARGVELVKSSNLPIVEIAHAVGYSNSNYFIRLFKGLTGLTPGEYRRVMPDHSLGV